VKPENAAAVKKSAVRAYGAGIVCCPPTLADREQALARVVAETGASVVHPYNDYRVIAGQATAAVELLEDVPDMDMITVPVGGGGLLSGTALAASARNIALHTHLQTAGNISDAQAHASDSMLSDAFEALIGAIHLDLGLAAATRFVEQHVLHARDLKALARQRVNHKSELLEAVQAALQAQPEYRIVAETGPSHARTFEVAVFIEGRELGRATDTSKKRAEQAAAGVALAHFKQI